MKSNLRPQPGAQLAAAVAAQGRASPQRELTPEERLANAEASYRQGRVTVVKGILERMIESPGVLEHFTASAHVDDEDNPTAGEYNHRVNIAVADMMVGQALELYYALDREAFRGGIPEDQMARIKEAA